MDAMAALVDINDLSFEYPLPGDKTRRAISHLSLQIQPGEYVAVIGANGSGKTTLARHLNGLLTPGSGSVKIAGMDTREAARQIDIRGIVGMVFQYPEDQIVANLVEEDVAFGLENQGLPPAQIRAGVEAALRQVGMWEAHGRPAYLLSAGQMQRVALAGVLAMKPQLIVFDEATAMLDPAGRQAVLEMMDSLNAQGITIVTVTHSMAEAARAGRVVVLDQGSVVIDGPAQSVFSRQEVLYPLGLDLPPAGQIAGLLRPVFPEIPAGILDFGSLVEAIPPYAGQGFTEGSQAAAGIQTESAEPLIDVMELSHVYLAGTPLAQQALSDANLQAAEASAHGLLGATGSGKSTLLQHLNGLLLPQEGYVRVGPYSLNNPSLDVRLVRRMAGLVAQLPETQFFEQYVGDEISYGPRMLGGKAGLREAVRGAMEMVGLDFEAFKDRLTFTLSGGERRKVALASILAIQPQILLLDEPTAGLDPASRRELVANLNRLHAQGRTLIVSSHQMDDLAELAEVLTVMKDGRDRISGSAVAVFANRAVLEECGLEQPEAARLAGALRAKGWPLSPGIYRAEELARAMGRLVREGAA